MMTILGDGFRRVWRETLGQQSACSARGESRERLSADPIRHYSDGYQVCAKRTLLTRIENTPGFPLQAVNCNAAGRARGLRRRYDADLDAVLVFARNISHGSSAPAMHDVTYCRRTSASVVVSTYRHLAINEARVRSTDAVACGNCARDLIVYGLDAGRG